MPYVFDPNDAHIKQALTNISVSYRNDETIYQDVLPIVDVEKMSDFYYVWNDEVDYNQTSDVMSATGRPNRIQLQFSTDLYACRPYGLMAELPVATLENADDPLRPLGKATENVRTQLDNNQEVRAAALVFNNASYAAGFKQTLSGTSQWSDYTNSDPITNFLLAIDTCIMRPNTMVIGADAWRALRQHPKILAAAFPLGGNAANRGMLSSTALQALLADEGIKKVLIGRRRVNTANPGAAAPTYSRAWGKHCAFIYVPDSPGLDTPAFGYTFSSLRSNITRDQAVLHGSRGVEYVKEAWEVDLKITAPKAGYYYENCVA